MLSSPTEVPWIIPGNVKDEEDTQRRLYELEQLRISSGPYGHVTSNHFNSVFFQYQFFSIDEFHIFRFMI